MSRLNPDQLRVNFLPGVGPEAPIVPRRYTLTHSDVTGNLYLTIGTSYNFEQIRGWYTRLMKDEVLTEWKNDQEEPSLSVYCHVSGGLVFGRSGWRMSIFRSVLEKEFEDDR